MDSSKDRKTTQQYVKMTQHSAEKTYQGTELSENDVQAGSTGGLSSSQQRVNPSNDSQGQAAAIQQSNGQAIDHPSVQESNPRAQNEASSNGQGRLNSSSNDGLPRGLGQSDPASSGNLNTTQQQPSAGELSLAGRATHQAEQQQQPQPFSTATTNTLNPSHKRQSSPTPLQPSPPRRGSAPAATQPQNLTPALSPPAVQAQQTERAASASDATQAQPRYYTGKEMRQHPGVPFRYKFRGRWEMIDRAEALARLPWLEKRLAPNQQQEEPVVPRTSGAPDPTPITQPQSQPEQQQQQVQQHPQAGQQMAEHPAVAELRSAVYAPFSNIAATPLNGANIVDSASQYRFPGCARPGTQASGSDSSAAYGHPQARPQLQQPQQAVQPGYQPAQSQPRSQQSTEATARPTGAEPGPIQRTQSQAPSQPQQHQAAQPSQPQHQPQQQAPQAPQAQRQDQQHHAQQHQARQHQAQQQQARQQPAQQHQAAIQAALRAFTGHSILYTLRLHHHTLGNVPLTSRHSQGAYPNAARAEAALLHVIEQDRRYDQRTINLSLIGLDGAVKWSRMITEGRGEKTVSSLRRFGSWWLLRRRGTSLRLCLERDESGEGVSGYARLNAGLSVTKCYLAKLHETGCEASCPVIQQPETDMKRT